MGGDEFAVVMPNTTSEGASQLLERVASALTESPVCFAPAVRLAISVSYGIASTGPETFDRRRRFSLPRTRRSTQ